MPSYSKYDVVLVQYPFSDLSSAKIRPAVVVNTPHPSQDIMLVPLTSKTQSLLAGEFVLSDWAAAGLSFLGLGAQPPTPEWGSMISAERNQVFSAPHLIIFPGLALVLTVLSFNLLGDGLRDALDPRLNR